MTVIVQENAIGVRFLIQLVDEAGADLDLTGTDFVKIRFSTPHVPSKEVTATPVNPPGTDGLVELFTTDGLMVPFGDWDIQGFVKYTLGDDLPTKTKAFVVRENIIKPVP
jgi:hypothetical protein